MRWRVLISASVGILLLTGAANADEDARWLCIADKITGFSYENGEWRISSFNSDDGRYIVSKKPTLFDNKKARYHVTKIGEEYGTECEENSPNSAGYIFCPGFFNYRINTRTLRYLLVYPIGYTSGADTNADTPFIEIGKCSPL